MTVRSPQTPITVAIAGATGTVGRGLIAAIRETDDIKVGAIITRDPDSGAVRELRRQLPADVVVSTRMNEDVAAVADALIDFTRPTVAPQNVLDAIRLRRPAVIGTSSVAVSALEEIQREAEKFGVGVVVASNYSLTAILLQRAVLQLARYLDDVEIVEYSSPSKPDTPGATVMEIARSLGEARQAEGRGRQRADNVQDPSLGKTVAGIPIHALRVDSYYHSFEVIFGLPGERLTLRHDATNGVEPYAQGALHALRAALSVKGLKHGLSDLLPSDRSGW